MTLPIALIADPPWAYRDALPGRGRGAAKHYPCMSISQLLRFPRPPVATSSWAFLWYTTAFAVEAHALLSGWGYAETGAELAWVKTTGPGDLVWDPDPTGAGWAYTGATVNTTKLAFGMGRTVRNCDERILIGRRGRPQPASHSVRSVFFAPVGRHSEKPERSYQVIEQLVGPKGPIVELFARRKRGGRYLCYGNEL